MEQKRGLINRRKNKNPITKLEKQIGTDQRFGQISDKVGKYFF